MTLQPDDCVTRACNVGTMLPLVKTPEFASCNISTCCAHSLLHGIRSVVATGAIRDSRHNAFSTENPLGVPDYACHTLQPCDGGIRGLKHFELY